MFHYKDAQDAFTPTPYTYEHKVVPFGRNREDRILQARTAAQLTEEHRLTFELMPTREEERRLFNAYMDAVRRQVAVTDEVNRAHNAWMKYAEQMR